MSKRTVCLIVFLLMCSTNLAMESVCDVAVVGAGPAGIAAALQAGRAGARTVLIERGFQVGGTMTSGGVNFPGLFHAWGRQVIDGCGYELVTNVVAAAGGKLPDFTKPTGKRHWLHQITVNAPLFALMAEEALLKAGVDVRCQTAPLAIAANKTNGKTTDWTLELVSSGERSRLRATCLIDATGDGTAVALAGGERRRAATTSPGSFNYVLEPHVDLRQLDIPALERAFSNAVARGELKRNDMRWSMASYLRHKGGIGNYIDAADTSTAARRNRTNREGHASLLRMYRFLRRQPGLERLELVSLSPEVGVRETYRVVGDCEITRKDYETGRAFRDAVAYAFYPIDLHDGEKGIHPQHLTEGVVAQIPLSALTVRDLRNVLAVGRCISSDREANSALRVQATCMATGQVAGEACALAVLRGGDVRHISLEELKNRLRRTGHIVP